jgi:hypothetical protein
MKTSCAIQILSAVKSIAQECRVNVDIAMLKC